MNAQPQPTPRFQQALESIRAGTWPAEAILTEIPAPTRVAPFSAAIDARIEGAGADLSAGSFVLLHDPERPVVWEGDLRVVSLARAELEPEMGADPFLAEVAWGWLAEALETLGPLPAAFSGTVTRTLSESFGTLRPRGESVGIEIRASWTPPTADAGAHLGAWLAFLTRLGGVEPLPKGVTRLETRR
ncbi:MAG: DUF3000 domain-containing protein [Bifidobacteriaceae bacterium]|nr:DUF3000 domain-containing protein [Bifidobacteriaceae bacterium]